MGQEQVLEAQVQQMGSGIGVGLVITWIVIYVFLAWCFARLAVRRGMPFTSSFIWALIPIANIFLMIKLAEKPMWWFVLLLIPIVNFVVIIMMWMSICEHLGRPGWWGIMIALVPIANIVFFLMLVFGKEQPQFAHA